MKKIILVLMVVLIAGFALAAGTELELTSEAQDTVSAIDNSVANFKITELRQDPFPANPGEYVNLYFKLDNVGGDVMNPKFEFPLSYPLSLDPSSKVQKFSYVESGEKITLFYKLKVDAQATPGDYEIMFKTFSGVNKDYFPYFFDIHIDDTTSNFDIAIQEITEDGVSLAISNIGKNDASSITLTVENQEDFELFGLASHIIGNLNAGDYTIVNVLINPNSEEEIVYLKTKVEYTDTVGNRRTLYKEVPVYMTLQTMQGFENLEDAVLNPNIEETSGGSSFFIWTTVILILVIVGMIIKKRRKIKKKK